MALETPPAAPAAATVVAPAPVAAPEVVAPAPVVQAAPAAVPTAYPPGVVPVPEAVYQELQGYKAAAAKAETERQVAETAAKQAALQAQIEKGQIKEAMELIRKQADDAAASERAQRAAVEEKAKRYALSGEVSRALASHNLVPSAAAQLADHWRNEFVVEATGDSFAVRTPTFQSVGDFIAAKLATPDYSHFVRSSTVGGVGHNPAAQTTAPTASPVVTSPVAPPNPKNFGEAIILQMQEIQKNQPGGSDPRLNPSAAMGLNARSIHRQA